MKLKESITIILSIFFMVGNPLYAQGDYDPINKMQKISYAKALDKVISNTSAMKNLEDSMNYFDEIKDDAESNRNDLYMTLGIPLEQAKATYTQIINLSRAIMNYEDQISNYEMNKKILSDTAEFALRTHLTNIKNYNDDIDLTKDKLNLVEKDFKITKLKYDRGLVSDIDLLSAQNSLAQERNSLVGLNISLMNEKHALNKLMGEDIDSDIEVEFEVTEGHFDRDIDSYVLDQLNNSPVILMKQKSLDEAYYSANSYSNLLDEVKSESVNNLRKTERDYQDTKKNLETNIRAAYNNLKGLESTYNTLMTNSQTLTNVYNTNLLKYKAGLISQMELDKSKLNARNIEVSLNKNRLARSNLIFSLDHSYLLAS